ncbi:FAD-dependent monooxygenase [uncultured Roseibium sp.]|uniref:NAD(P)/FAD-dependent oxidoreductase n=1 Tax=uncultured Roseibium sp. TaxID=1936171 RepID=UPI00321762D0
MNSSEDIVEGAPVSSRTVIVGAGIAGLLAARVLADDFAEVVLIERDRLQERTGPRPGVPQSAHGHLLLAAGFRTITELFPDLDRELVEAGAVPGDICADGIVNVRGRRLPRFASGLKTLLMSRTLLEGHIRQRVTEIPNVAIRTGCRSTGFLFDQTSCRVTGVRLRTTDGTEEDLAADLVIDASGRSAAASAWLGENGFGRVPETVVDAHVGYASRRFSLPAKQEMPSTGDWKVAACAWLPPDNRRAGGLYREENGVWVASLVGALEAIPSTDEKAFLDHARRLEDPALHEALHHGMPLSKIAGYRVAGSRRRRFSPLARRLKRLVVIGDALCTVNPFYGQGMTIAALQARALQGRFRRGAALGGTPLDRAARHAQRACETVTAVPWLFSTSEDLRHGAAVQGRRTFVHRVINWYVNRALAVGGPRTIRALYNTMSLVDPLALARPGTVFDILLMPFFRRDRYNFRKNSHQRPSALEERCGEDSI